MANLLSKMDEIRVKTRMFPTLPGCYLMYDSFGAVLYVGKSKNLRSRVASYFNKKRVSPKTKALMSRVVDIKFIVTLNESEALILENSLIKEHSPKYNISLKDDRSYPYVIMDHKEQFPTLKLIRKPPQNLKNKKIWGPFVVGTGISEVLKVVTKVFKLRDCSLTKFSRAKTPCLLFQIDNCSGPCCHNITAQNYLKNIEMAILILEGEGCKPIKQLEKEMVVSAGSEKFEKAAQIRDALALLKSFNDRIQKQSVEYLDSEHSDIDFIYMYRESDFDLESDVIICHVRKGKFIGNSSFFFKHLSFEYEDVFDRNLSFVFNYYDKLNGHFPKKLILQEEKCFDIDVFTNVMDRKNGEGLTVKRESYEKYPLLLAAKQQAIEDRRVREIRFKYLDGAILELKQILGVDGELSFIECFDIAVFQGSSPVAAKVAFKDGRPDKENYRHYKLQERPEGNNDYAMMQEAFKRRLKSGKLPDLFVIDGGLGQINVCIHEMKKSGTRVPIVGIAKGKERSKYDRLVIEGDVNKSYLLDGNSSISKLFIPIRDEAHRFSRKLHHKLEEKRVIPRK